MKYNIIHCQDSDSLAGEVNLAIKEGWEPLGGLLCSTGRFYQAMIKREEPADEIKPLIITKVLNEISAEQQNPKRRQPRTIVKAFGSWAITGAAQTTRTTSTGALTITPIV